MTNKRQIAVSPLGLREADLRLLKSICALSGARDRPYAFFVSDEPVALPTLWVVDAGALSRWQGEYKRDGALGVLISEDEAPAGDEPVLQTPVTASRLLAALDGLVDKELARHVPLVIGDTSGHGAEALPGSDTGTAMSFRYTALVVDDSPTIRKQIELGLRRNHVNAVSVATGEEALDALKNLSFDLIFLDVILPGTDGYRVCKSIKRDPASKQTPVIMLTSKSSTFDRVRGSMVGCDTYLTKPVDSDTFNQVVATYLSAKDRSTSRQYG